MKPETKPENKPEKRKLRIELGLNLHAAPIPQTNPNMRIFPLQNALVDITEGEDSAGAAWYSRLTVGDELSFRLVDISSLRDIPYKPDYPNFVLTQFFFSQPTTGMPANPFTEPIVEWRLSDRLTDRPSPVFSMDGERPLPTWGIVGRTAEGGVAHTLELADFAPIGQEQEEEGFRAFELAVVLRMVRGGWVNHYVFDPEMIVSETDNEGDQSGGKRR